MKLNGAMCPIDPAIQLTIALGVGAIFALSGAAKLRGIAAFRAAVSGYRIIPPFAERTFAYSVPILEIAGAAAVVSPMNRIGAILLLALSIAFTLAITVNLIRGRRDIDCGCFGPAMRTSISGAMIARNAVLIVLIGMLCATTGTRALNTLDLYTAAMGAASILILYLASNHILANAGRGRMLVPEHA